MTNTANLALPVLEAAQAQKHVTHNEALRLLDTLVQLAVLDRDLNAPPGSPIEGQRWIVKASPSPTGAWAGHGHHVAAWQDGGWTFSAPKAGWLAFVVDEGVLLAWSGTAWLAALDVMSGITTLQNLALLGVGTTADSTNPLSAKLNNVLWTAKTVAEGGDGNLRYKMSKESAAKTLSLLMQDNFSGRAEIGLTGDDNLHVKVSPDGSAWLDAVTIDKSTAKLTLGTGFTDQTATRAQIAAAPLDAAACNGMQVNGGMEISQENGTAGVTLTATSSLQTKYLVDGVMAAYRGTFVAAGQQVSDAPSGYNNSLKFTMSTAQSSLSSSDELSVFIPVEGMRASRLALGTAGAAAVSFAFWVKAHRTGSYSGSLRNAGKARSYPFSFTVGAADTWEYKTVTVAAGDTSGTWLKDTNVGLYLNLCIAGGSSRLGTAAAWAGADYSGATGSTNGVAATSDTFQITGLVALPGIELPASDRAPFIMRAFDRELPLSRRYYQKTFAYGTAPVQNAGVNTGEIVWSAIIGGAVTAFGVRTVFVPSLRAAPTITFYNPQAANAQARDLSAGADCTSTSAPWSNTDALRIQCTTHAASAAGNLLGVHATFDARL